MCVLPNLTPSLFFGTHVVHFRNPPELFQVSSCVSIKQTQSHEQTKQESGRQNKTGKYTIHVNTCTIIVGFVKTHHSTLL